MPALRLIGTAALAVAGAVLAPAALCPAAVAAPLPAVAPSHVAIVVAGDRSACVPWQRGMSGDDVLAAGHFRLGYNQAGLITQIDGVPAHPDPYQAYWAYFNDAGAGWKYNGLGPASTHPAAGSVEGWVYDPAAGAPAPPPAASYAAICAGQDQRPAPARPATRSTTPARRSPAPAAASSRPAPTHGARATTPPATRGSAPATAAHRLAKRTARSAPASTVGSSPPSVPSAPSAASTGVSPDAATASTSPVALPHRADNGPSQRPALITVLALIVVAALGGLALWRARGGHDR